MTSIATISFDTGFGVDSTEEAESKIWISSIDHYNTKIIYFKCAKIRQRENVSLDGIYGKNKIQHIIP